MGMLKEYLLDVPVDKPLLRVVAFVVLLTIAFWALL